mgnify:CR=1 FL=1|jgi:hypothetical protein|tara:strand:- start:8139 stop:8330 length:192 start_codon:yes stop_codon:yes gene_type:complete
MPEDGIIHLVESGDSLGIIQPIWACGKSKEGEKGAFGNDGTFHEINCPKCMETNMYKEMEREL